MKFLAPAILLFGIFGLVLHPSPAIAATTACLRVPFLEGLAPTEDDLDGDGIPNEFDRLPDDPTNACLDFDGDGLNDLWEYLLGTDPQRPDSDGDGLTDGLEFFAGLDPLDPSDALEDWDNDGFPNWYEAFERTSLFDPSSKPALPVPLQPGRYVQFLSAEVPAWGRGFIEFYDLNADGTAVVYPGGLTATWTQTGAFVHLVFNPGQVLFRSFNFDPELGRQTEVVTYILERVLGRSENGAAEQWRSHSVILREIPEKNSSEVFKSFAQTSRPAAHVGGLDPLIVLPGKTYALPCSLTENNPLGAYSVSSCRYSFGAEDSVTNMESGVTGTVSQGPHGELMLGFAGGRSETFYVLADFGGLRRVAAFIEDSGQIAVTDSVAAEVDLLLDWPGEVAGIYQVPWSPLEGWLNGVAFDIQPGGLFDLVSHDPGNGGWSGFLWGSWEKIGTTISVTRYYAYVNGAFRTIRDASDCAAPEVDCRPWIRRTLRPIAVIDGEIVIIHNFEFFDNSVLEGDDVLTRFTQDIRSYRRTPFLDLDLDGVPDAIDPDDDGDGLPDSWEIGYFFNSSFSDSPYSVQKMTGDDDPDRDGFTNFAEYLNDTDPLAPSSVPFAGYLATLSADVQGSATSVAVSLRSPYTGVNKVRVLAPQSGQALVSMDVPDLSRDVKALVAVKDLDGNGIDELAVLGIDPGYVANRAFVRFGENGGFIRNVSFFDPDWSVLDAVSLPDLGDDGLADLAVLAQNDSSGEIAVQVREPVSGAFVRNVFFLNSQWKPLQLLSLENLDSNPGPELAVLATNEAGQIVVMVKDAKTNTFIKNIFFLNSNWYPIHAVVLEDFNGNSASEIGLLAQNKFSNQLVFMVKDAATNTFLNNVFPLGSDWEPIKAIAIPDENSNGTQEIAVLGVSGASGKLIIQVRDSSSGEFLRNVPILGSNWRPLDIVHVPGAGGQSDGFSVLAIRPIDNVAVVQTIDSFTGAVISNHFPN